jgi:hypothetical protein
VGEIREQVLGLVEDLGAHGDGELDRVSRRTVLRLAPTVTAALTLEAALALEVREVTEVGVRKEDDVAAVAAVAAVRAALRHVLLAAEAERAVAAATASHLDAGAIVEDGSS